MSSAPFASEPMTVPSGAVETTCSGGFAAPSMMRRSPTRLGPCGSRRVRLALAALADWVLSAAESFTLDEPLGAERRGGGVPEASACYEEVQEENPAVGLGGKACRLDAPHSVRVDVLVEPACGERGAHPLDSGARVVRACAFAGVRVPEVLQDVRVERLGTYPKVLETGRPEAARLRVDDLRREKRAVEDTAGKQHIAVARRGGNEGACRVAVRYASEFAQVRVHFRARCNHESNPLSLIFKSNIYASILACETLNAQNVYLG